MGKVRAREFDAVMLLSPEEAEDATQECLLRVDTRLSHLEGRGQPP
jgi:DNA-directed RNA polymerase specialized sigma24 family protein